MTFAISLMVTMGLVTTGTASAATTARCEFPTYQYVFTGVDGTYRDAPGGNVRGYLITGDLLNSGFSPSHTGWIEGNFYTSSGGYLGSGWALRQYFSYVRYWC
ncbi:hypothetical protein [Actinophytocola sp.]|uniref:hypothetical protein n=1 Tax=Actinophytocola sp. TaxID=1872138 RepID=UPI002ED50923